MPHWLELLSGILAIVGIVGSAAFYLLYVATKANREGKDETIETLERSRDAYKERNQELEKLVVGLQSENRTLREIATQTPEILRLTKVVSESVVTNSKVADNVAALTDKVGQLVTQQGAK